MKHAPRLAVAVVMLAVVYALAAVVVLGVAVALVLAVNAGGAWSVLAGIFVVVLLAALGVALFSRRRRRKKGEAASVRITTEEQPLFWVEIYRVAEGLEIDPPDELMLFPDAEVSVSQGRTWMGLRPGVRRMHLGLPLLAGMTERELRAVIASESCRRWGPTSLARVVYRGREMIGRVADRVGEKSIVGRIVGRFGRTYLAVSAPITRDHELEADRLSADISGNNATAAALREYAVLSKAWAAFVDGYAGPAAAAGRRPEALFAGFTSFLQDPDRRAQLAESADETGSQEPSAFASQASMEDRLAAIESLPEDDIHDRSGPALGLMRNPDKLIRQVEECMFRESGSVPATWEDILPEAGEAEAHKDAMHLQRLGREGGLGPTLSVAALLELLSLGLVDEMVRPMLPAGASEQAERKLAGRLVTGFLATAAIESGTASYRFSWATPRQLVDEHGAPDDLPLLVDAALADVGQVPALELWLQAHRVSHELVVGTDAVQAVRRSQPGVPKEAADEEHRDTASEAVSEDADEDAGPSMIPGGRTASVQ
ncbi:MAG: hypothetical protein HHJ11_08520 [Phycicoccus sp.]|nr:hypothetical protein [Phycicoccus sp.]NMM33810.1 hypothetical protein [Phycicoccus sp.]